MTAASEAGQEVAEVITRWIQDFVCRPHPDVGRDGDVCPFVGPAMRAGTLVLRVRWAGPDPTLESVTDLIRAGVAEFATTDWAAGNPNLHTLVVVVPDLPEGGFGLLDEAQAGLKMDNARRGVMVGPFHPLSMDAAVRRPDFLVCRSPLPLFVVRNMAFHDIVFMHQRSEWFGEYSRRFGQRYRPDLNVDPLYVSLFYQAARAFDPRWLSADR